MVVYFSHTGNTRTIAGYIHETVKSDLVEIKTVDTYTDDYDTLLEQIRKEVASEYCPPLTTKIEDISSYDVVFIGYPIWVETAAPPIRSFLTTHDLAGKTVVPFCTSGTSSAEASSRLVRSLCPQSTVLEGIQIRRGTYDTAYDRVVAWLQKLGIANLNNEKGDEK
ncbi:flavodoxin [Phocaeicola dorei]|nr:flavodoxin [Phocaeicola dorei]